MIKKGFDKGTTLIFVLVGSLILYLCLFISFQLLFIIFEVYHNMLQLIKPYLFENQTKTITNYNF